MLRILEYQSYLASQGTPVIFLSPDILSIVSNGTGSRTDQSIEMLDQCRFSTSCMSDNSGKQGRPSKCNRTILNGIVWIARSGAPWRDLPERYGPWQTVYSRFRKWMEDGILDNIFRVLSLDAELSELSIDASIVQAHQHSAGAKKGGHPTKSDTVAVEQVQKSMPL